MADSGERRQNWWRAKKRTLESRSSDQFSSTVPVASEDAEWQKVGQAAFRGPALSKYWTGRWFSMVSEGPGWAEELSTYIADVLGQNAIPVPIGQQAISAPYSLRTSYRKPLSFFI